MELKRIYNLAYRELLNMWSREQAELKRNPENKITMHRIKALEDEMEELKEEYRKIK